MARRKSKTLTEVELEIMQVVWRSDEVFVNDISKALAEAGKPLAESSIRTMLAILQEKGHVARRRAGPGHAYRAIVSRKQARKRIVKDLLDRAFEGSAMDLVAALIDERSVSKADLDAVKKLIRAREKEDKR